MAKKLLLAEDSLTIQKVFALTFQKSDISLTTVDNGEDAVRLAGEISPDLVVADVTLADKDGFSVSNALRNSEKTRSCPILILAGSLPPFDEQKFRQCGANAVLFKPFESQELIDKVNMLLQEGDVPVDAAAEKAEAETGEAWDFSDVLEDVEDAGTSSVRGQPVATLLPEDTGSSFRGEDVRSLGEFDVSLEEIAGEAEGKEPMAVGEPAETEAPAIPEATVEEISGDGVEEIVEDLPFLDLQSEDLGFVESPAGAESILPVEEARDGAEEWVITAPPADPVPEPLEEPGSPVEDALERIPDRVLESVPFVPPDPSVAELTAVPEGPFVSEAPDFEESVAPEERVALDESRREEFSDRTREIFEKVAAETVEKVMWEMMDRLSGEIRQQIREAVEMVAWDVIPATAESLIREEIERIRGKAGE